MSPRDQSNLTLISLELRHRISVLVLRNPGAKLARLFNRRSSNRSRRYVGDSHTSTIVLKGEGFHTWTEDEIAQFERRHSVGSKAGSRSR